MPQDRLAEDIIFRSPFDAEEIGLGGIVAVRHARQCRKDAKAAAVLLDWTNELSNGSNFSSHHLNVVLCGHKICSATNVSKPQQKTYRMVLGRIWSEILPIDWGDKARTVLPPMDKLVQYLPGTIADLECPFNEDDIALCLEVVKSLLRFGPNREVGELKFRTWLDAFAWVIRHSIDCKSLKEERASEIVRWVGKQLSENCGKEYEAIAHDSPWVELFNKYSTGGSVNLKPRALAISYCDESWADGKEFAGILFDSLESAGLKPNDARQIMELFWDARQKKKGAYGPKWWAELERLLQSASLEKLRKSIMDFTDKAFTFLEAQCPAESLNYYFPALLFSGLFASAGAINLDVEFRPLIPRMQRLVMNNTPGIATNLVRGLQQRGTREAAITILMMKRAIKHKTVQAMIDTSIAKMSKDLGLKVEELGETMLSDFGLDQDGRRNEMVGSWSLSLELDPQRGVELITRDAAGKESRKIPEALKKSHSRKIKELQAEAKQIASEYGILRDQLERSYLNPDEIDAERFELFFVNHPLGHFMAKRLIWIDANDKTFLGAEAKSPESPIRLWHPLMSDSSATAHWRQRIMREKIRQPFKQAFRETYAPTAVEEELRSRSSQFAGFILDGKRFHGLRKSRGWGGDYGGYQVDDDPERESTLLINHKLGRARLRWEMDIDRADFPMHSIHFMTKEPILLKEMNYEIKEGKEWTETRLSSLPPIAFSEIMRDLDLFVSVAGVMRVISGAKLIRESLLTALPAHAPASMEAARVCADLLKFWLAALELKEVSVGDSAIIIQGLSHKYELDILTGEAAELPERRSIESVSQAKIPKDIFQPFEGEDEWAAELLGKILTLRSK